MYYSSYELVQKNSKSIWTKIRRKQTIDSIQNSSGKSNHQAKGHWEDEQKAEQSRAKPSKAEQS